MNKLWLSISLIIGLFCQINCLDRSFQYIAEADHISGWSAAIPASQQYAFTLPANGHLTGLKDSSRDLQESENRVPETCSAIHQVSQIKALTGISGGVFSDKNSNNSDLLRLMLFPFHVFW